MFNVTIGFSVKVLGCPERGIAAVDFRKANGLPEATTNEVRLSYEAKGVESLCRELKQYLDNDADLILRDDSGHNGEAHYTVPSAAKPLVSGATVGRDGWRAQPIYAGGHHTIPAAVVAAFLADPGNNVVALVRELEKAAGESAERFEARKAEAERVQAERDENSRRQRAESEATEARKKAEEQERLGKLRAWAEANGSPLLAARLTGGFEWVSLAHDEFIARQFVGLSGKFETADIPAGYSFERYEPRLSPTLAELDALKEASAAMAGKPAVASLAMTMYVPEDEDDDLETMSRPELRVMVTCPDGYGEHRDFLVPAGEVVEVAC